MANAGEVDPDLRVWQAKLEAARASQASDLKAAAEKWSGSIAALIGTLGSISVLVVPKALADFSNDDLRNVVFVIVLAAGVLGLGALAAATSAAQGWPKIYSEIDASAYRQKTIDKASNGVRLLQLSRWLTLGALLCIVAASVISQIDTVRAPASDVHVVVIHRDGTNSCGSIGAVPKSDVSSVVVVTHC